MINPEKLTVKAGEAFNEAITLARRNGNPVVYDLHLLAALLEQDESIVVPVLQKLGASVTALREQVAREIDRYPKQSDAQPTLSRELNQVYDTLQDQIGYETVRGDASTGWLRLGALTLAVAAVAAVGINRRLPL